MGCQGVAACFEALFLRGAVVDEAEHARAVCAGHGRLCWGWSLADGCVAGRRMMFARCCNLPRYRGLGQRCTPWANTASLPRPYRPPQPGALPLRGGGAAAATLGAAAPCSHLAGSSSGTLPCKFKSSLTAYHTLPVQRTQSPLVQRRERAINFDSSHCCPQPCVCVFFSLS